MSDNEEMEPSNTNNRHMPSLESDQETAGTMNRDTCQQDGDEGAGGDRISEDLASIYTSRMEKDPLNIGVPLPVIVRRNQTNANAIRAASGALRHDSLEEEKEEETESSEPSREVKATAPSKAYAGVAVGIQATEAELLQDTSSKMGAKADLLLLAESKQASAVNASAVDITPQFSEPGGYAIGGPGLQETDGDAVAMEDIDDLEGQQQQDPQRNLSTGGYNHNNTNGIPNNSSIPFSVLTDNDASNYLVEATLVLDNSQQHNNNSSNNCHVENLLVQAEAKPLPPSFKFFSRRSVLMGYGMCIVVIVIAVTLAVVIQQKTSNGDYQKNIVMQTPYEGIVPATVSPTMTPLPTRTLDRIRQAGILRCGTVEEFASFFDHVDSVGKNNQEMNDNDQDNNSTSTSQNETESPAKLLLSNSFTRSYCRAIASAVLGPNASFTYVNPTTDQGRYELLAAGASDLLLHRQSLTMARDIYEEKANMGLSFSIPYLYSGIAFTGIPSYVDCADDSIKTFGNCSDMIICINRQSYFTQELLLRVAQRQVVLSDESDVLIGDFLQGKCHVVASEASSLAALIIRALGYTGDLAVGTREYTSEMWALTTVDSDPEWSDFVNSVTMALLAAEQAGITKETAREFGETNLFGEEYKYMFMHAIQASGNWGELYNFPVPRDGRNLVNEGNSGLLVTPPLGNIDREGPGPVESGTLEAVIQRGALHCGVRGRRPGFAMYSTGSSKWEGIDVDFCRAVAASLFDGGYQNVVLYEVSDRAESNGFDLLDKGIVDIYAGAIWTVQNDIREPFTQKGYSFSQPYFYGPVNDTMSFEENLCLATRQDDPQWSSFVSWTAQSLIYAEEQGISQWMSSEMPLVYSFGSDLSQMFGDAIDAVGNYGEVYERHLSEIMPRGGRNELNLLNEKGRGPLRYLPPGFREAVS